MAGIGAWASQWGYLPIAIAVLLVFVLVVWLVLGLQRLFGKQATPAAREAIAAALETKESDRTLQVEASTENAPLGDYNPICAITITNKGPRDLDRCLVKIEQIEPPAQSGMPSQFVLRTDGQIRGGRSGRFTLSKGETKNISLIFWAKPRRNEWFFKDENGKDYFYSAKSFQMLLSLLGGEQAEKVLSGRIEGSELGRHCTNQLRCRRFQIGRF